MIVKCYPYFYLIQCISSTFLAINPCETNSTLCEFMDLCLLDHSTPAYYRCSCPPFMQLNGDRRTCSDLDECSSNIHGCNEYETCVNIGVTSENYKTATAGYTCECKQGFYYEPTLQKCVDIDECRTECLWGAHCTNYPGGYNCSCKNGYVGDRNTCTDVNECLTEPCGGLGNCTNLPGSYRCRCKAGYTFGSGTCVDIDECAIQQIVEYCSSFGAVCANTKGGYFCACNYSNLESSSKICTGILCLYICTILKSRLNMLSCNLLKFYDFTPEIAFQI